MPILYGPQSHILKDQTLSLRNLLRMKPDVIGFNEQAES